MKTYKFVLIQWSELIKTKTINILLLNLSSSLKVSLISIIFIKFYNLSL